MDIQTCDGGDIAFGGIAAAIRNHARSRSLETALVFDREEMSWEALAIAVERLGDRFASIDAGGKIALSLPNSQALVLLILGAIRASRQVQVLDPDWPPDIREPVLQTLKPKSIVANLGIQGGECIDPYGAIDEILTGLGCDGRAAFEALPPGDPSRIFYTGFTSGSTGTPKGFQRSEQSWIDSFRGDNVEFSFTPDDVFVALGSLAHSLFLYAVLRGLYAGGTTVFFRQFRPDRILRRLAERRGSVVYGVPTQYDAMASVAEASGARCPTVRIVLSSGAKLPGALKQRLRKVFPQAEICEFYGTSEQSYVTVARDGETPPGSVGRAFPGVDISIRDTSGHAQPTGGTGHVFASSALLFRDYELAVNPALVRVGEAISVGDVGYLDSKGYLYLVGRSDRMIISSGKNIYPEEVENVLIGHPSIAAAAVIGISDPRRGSRLLAVLRVTEAPPDLRRDLISWCRERLPLYKVPMVYVECSDWPLTASHKTNLPVLRSLVKAGKLPEIS